MHDVHLVDGTFELFRSYFGAPKRERADGVEIGATRGVVASLLALLKDPGVTHVGIAFDTVIESFRNRLFAGYKDGSGIEPRLHSQFPLVEEAARALGLVTWSMIEHECDDALATMAVRAREDAEVRRVYVLSPDKDLTQVVSGDRVVCVDRIRKSTLDEAGVREKFGVPPTSIPDYLALVGDVADGVPGLKGFGAKSAAALLARYGTLESIPRDAWPADLKLRGAEGLRQRFAAGYRDALLYKKLTTLVLDVPLAEGVSDLRWRGPNPSALAALAHTLEDEGLVARVDKVLRLRVRG